MTQAVRIDAAKAAAPYVHPRLSAVQVQATDDVHGMTYAQINAELRELMQDPAVRQFCLDHVLETKALPASAAANN
jgi:hypothetical protein